VKNGFVRWTTYGILALVAASMIAADLLPTMMAE
jgi:hypothetical protein